MSLPTLHFFCSPLVMKRCSKGTILRKAYTYKGKNGSKVRVRSSCVRSKGLRARGKSPKAILPPLKKGTLRNFGYGSDKSPSLRRASLRRASKSLGRNRVIRKLNAVAVLTKNTAPKKSRIFRADMRWVQGEGKN